MHSVLKNLPMSIHVFFLWIQIFMATDFKSVCGRRSTIGHLIKTKAGKMFLQQSSKGENSTKRVIKENDYSITTAEKLRLTEEMAQLRRQVRNGKRVCQCQSL